MLDNNKSLLSEKLLKYCVFWEFCILDYKMKESSSQRLKNSRWIQPPESAKLGVPFLKAVALRPLGDNKVQYEATTDRGVVKFQVLNTSSYVMSAGNCYDDMCEMDILNEPEVLHNLVQRYIKDQIFTFIGPTLIVINPYKILPQYFGNDSLFRIRQKILDGTTKDQDPHIYLMAGKAYTSMIDQQKKQAIVISGESGAGKTESTKYCLQLLTSLSHKQKHAIQQKILACNPVLEAFGNSKTIRNDNSSRFGKYMRIFFTSDNTIAGASIQSYLLEKSRVVTVAQNQRSYHIFYALIASKYSNLQKPEKYKYLQKSKCYTAAGIDDKSHFQEIQESMTRIGFTEQDQRKIWELLSSILELGNIEFNDREHLENEQKPCIINNKHTMDNAAKRLGIGEADLQKILLFEKKIILKEIAYSAYNKKACHGNINTLSKAIYNAIFEFILFKINISLKPTTNKNYNSISILDIFGFENFQNNSFEQFCINFTNEKLLKLYNQYVFERQMNLLKEDGLAQEIGNINPPANDNIIEVISGKLSLFSIINDNTMPKQYNDSHIISGIQNKLGKSPVLSFDKLDKNKFTIFHSQCNVSYSIEGFKEKNQDKILEDIANIVNNLFEHQSKKQKGKTLLEKFEIEINDLMSQLCSSSVHFIRCIKPNEKKIPNNAEERYILTQIRYLGVFETIQIRKKTFPSRWLYKEFIERFGMLFPGIIGNEKAKTQKILKQLNQNSKGYLLGNLRVYMDSEIEHKLSVKLHEFMKKKIEAGKKIWKSYKKYKFKKQIFAKLKILVKRIHIWKKFSNRKTKEITANTFKILKEHNERKKQEERQKKNQKLKEMKQKREIEEQQKKFEKIQKSKENINKLLPLMNKNLTKFVLFNIFMKLKNQPKKGTKAPIHTSTKQENKNSTYMTNKQPQDLSESVLNESIVESNEEVYKRNVSNNQQKRQHKFNQSFVDQPSIDYSQRVEILFQGYLPVPFYDNKKNEKNLSKLRSILSETYKFQINESQQDFFSPASCDGKFTIQETPQEKLNEIIAFNAKDFFKEKLRKRTNFIGMDKDQDDILVVKHKPLTKSLSKISSADQPAALKVFKVILKIGEQTKLENVFKYIEQIITMCQNTSPEVKNEVFLQLIRQSNSDNELSSVRVIQTMAVFLHIYSPDNDFLMAGLNFFFKKLTENSFSEKQVEYINYVFKKIIRKMEHTTSICYMPIKYQMMALMCKRQISVPVYLSVGNSILIRVESYETFSDIKKRVLQEFGIDHKRIRPQYFTFFEIMNFENQELEETPINEKQVVWDTVTYWQRAKQRYQEKQITPPAFFLMLKIRYIYECHYDDEESVQLMFHQCYFDYFIGRIRLDIHNMGALAACVKLLKFRDNPKNDTTGAYPIWATKRYEPQQLVSKMMQNAKAIEDEGLEDYDIKYRFLTICEECPLSLSLVIQTQQNLKLFLRPKKIYLTEKNQIIQEIPIKKITKFAEDDQKFVFEIRGATQTKIIYTEHGSICCSFLSLLPRLITSSKH